MKFVDAHNDGAFDETIQSLTATEFLRYWVLQENVSKSAVNRLLKGLKYYLPELPVNYRTLLKTPRASTIIEMPPGEFVYLGISRTLENIRNEAATTIAPRNDTIYVQLNIDGTSTMNNGLTQLWPIQCRVVHPFVTFPFVVAIYAGHAKPASVWQFLCDVINELRVLRITGLRGICHTNVVLKSVVCDKPAKAFVQQSMSHMGYGGCEKCMDVGRYRYRKIVYSSKSNVPRTNTSLRSMHAVNPFSRLPYDLSSLFPLDYMHCVCLGVMRRLARLWKFGDKGGIFKLDSHKSLRLDRRMKNLRNNLPSEFARKCLPWSLMKNWKAAEYRQFILYIGPVALRGILPTDKYRNFMDLSVAIFILCHPQYYSSYNAFAKNRLQTFVRVFKNIYGESNMVYNVHVLLHLADDADFHGPLDTFSAFLFESNLGKLKRLVRKPTNVAAQLYRRVTELQGNDPAYFKSLIMLNSDKCSTCHVDYFIMNNVKYGVSSPDNIVCINDHPSIIRSIFSHNNSTRISYQRFIECRNYFKVSWLISKDLSICVAQSMDDEIHECMSTDIQHKYVSLPHKNFYILYPLLHTCVSN